jgi:hypothetical protein
LPGIKVVTHWTACDRKSSKWIVFNRALEAYVNYYLNTAREITQSTADTVTQPPRQVKSDFCAVLIFAGAIT